MAEQGLPNYLVEGWFAVVGPARLPAADVKRIHAAVSTAFAAPEVKEAMAKQGKHDRRAHARAVGGVLRSEMKK